MARNIRLVAPEVRYFGDIGHWPWPKVRPPIPSMKEPVVRATVVWTTSGPDADYGDVTENEVADFVKKAMTDGRHRYLVKVATAHIIAQAALEDPWFRADRYATRIDEYLLSIWELAQEIYEHNADLQVQEWPPIYTRPLRKRLQGFYRPKGCFRTAEDCSSGMQYAPKGKASKP